MLVKKFQTEFVRPPHPQARHLRCTAHLDADISAALPYLHTALRGHQYFPETPSLTIRYHDRLITLYPRKILINIVQDPEDAELILAWLRQAINDTWEQRDRIQPGAGVTRKLDLLPILKLLPKTNCRQCGEPTCLVFASQVAAGAKDPADCPALDRDKSGKAPLAGGGGEGGKIPVE